MYFNEFVHVYIYIHKVFGAYKWDGLEVPLNFVIILLNYSYNDWIMDCCLSLEL